MMDENLKQYLLKLVFSLVSGGIIGLNREKVNRPAGLRTHSLIILGSTIITILSSESFNGDNARLAAQIVSGIGFLGAGTIIKKGNNVKGLTTAATLWVSAAIGIAYGSGNYYLGVLGTIFTLIIVSFNKFSKKTHYTSFEITLNEKIAFRDIVEKLDENKLVLKTFSHDKEENKDIFFIKVYFTNYQNVEKFKKELMFMKEIDYIEEE